MTPNKVLDELRAVRAQAMTALQSIDRLIAKVQGEQTASGPVEEESSDHLDYRDNRDPDGTLSVRGLRVMMRLFKRNLTADDVAERMTVSPTGTRRRLREYKTTGTLVYRFPGQPPQSIAVED